MSVGFVHLAGPLCCSERLYVWSAFSAFLRDYAPGFSHLHYIQAPTMHKTYIHTLKDTLKATLKDTLKATLKDTLKHTWEHTLKDTF